MNINNKFLVLFLSLLSIITQHIDIFANEPNIEAIGAILIDMETGRKLYGKNENQPLAMASTTKIMTAILAIESDKLNETVTISKKAQIAPEVKMNIKEGEQYILKDLLYGLMLSSYNDTAVAIAEYLGGSSENFCNMMTKKAIELGCKDTIFKTPNGLDLEDHHSTAYDMAIITKYALENEIFKEIIKTPNYLIKELSGKSIFDVNNKNRLLNEYSGAIGVKTGFTGKAGHCFVGAATKNNKTLISVVLGSGWGNKGKEQKWIDTKNLLNYGFENFEDIEITKKGDFAGNIPVLFSKTPLIKTEICENITLPLNKYEKQNIKIKINLPDNLEAPINKDEIIGKAEIIINDKKEYEVNIKTSETIERNDLYTSSKKIINIWQNSGNILLNNILQKINNF